MVIIQVLEPTVSQSSLIPFDIRQELAGLHLKAERDQGGFAVTRELLEEALGNRHVSPQLTGYLATPSNSPTLFQTHEVRLCEDLSIHPY